MIGVPSLQGICPQLSETIRQQAPSQIMWIEKSDFNSSCWFYHLKNCSNSILGHDTFTPRLLFGYLKKLFVICDEIMEQSRKYDSRKTTQIRQKIREILGRDCTLNDEMLVKNYAVTTDGD
jgi:hypothetical protein